MKEDPYGEALFMRLEHARRMKALRNRYSYGLSGGSMFTSGGYYQYPDKFKDNFVSTINCEHCGNKYAENIVLTHRNCPTCGGAWWSDGVEHGSE